MGDKMKQRDSSVARAGSPCSQAPAPPGDTGCQPVTPQPRASSPCSQENESVRPDWHRRGRYIPHRENKRLQTITWRLFDSLPADVVTAMKAELAALRSAPDTPEKAARLAELRKTIDHYEDAGYGSCFLKDERIARIVADNLRHFDGTRYRLISFCIMPNHVHVLIEAAERWSLSQILHGWRSYTANEANKILGRTGRFWMEEYFDRFIRDDNHFRSVLSYIRMNPVKAGLTTDPDAWPWSWEVSPLPRASSPCSRGTPGDTGCQPVMMQTRASSPCSQENASAPPPGDTGCQPVPPQPRASSPCSQGNMLPSAHRS